MYFLSRLKVFFKDIFSKILKILYFTLKCFLKKYFLKFHKLLLYLKAFVEGIFSKISKIMNLNCDIF